VSKHFQRWRVAQGEAARLRIVERGNQLPIKQRGERDQDRARR
jgi:hypothetical protein